MELAKFRKNVLINIVPRLDCWVMLDGSLNHSHSHAERVPRRSNEHIGFAYLFCANDPCLAYLEYVRVLGYVASLMCQVLPVPIRKISGHQELLSARCVECHFLRKILHTLQLHTLLFRLFSVGR